MYELIHLIACISRHDSHLPIAHTIPKAIASLSASFISLVAVVGNTLDIGSGIKPEAAKEIQNMKRIHTTWRLPISDDAHSSSNDNSVPILAVNDRIGLRGIIRGLITIGYDTPKNKVNGWIQVGQRGWNCRTETWCGQVGGRND
jgi:hypothetical protein